MDRASQMIEAVPFRAQMTKAMDLLVQYFSLMNTITKVVLVTLLVMVLQRHKSNKACKPAHFDIAIVYSIIPVICILPLFDMHSKCVQEPLAL